MNYSKGRHTFWAKVLWDTAVAGVVNIITHGQEDAFFSILRIAAQVATSATIDWDDMPDAGGLCSAQKWRMYSC